MEHAAEYNPHHVLQQIWGLHILSVQREPQYEALREQHNAGFVQLTVINKYMRSTDIRPTKTKELG
jgi:hypothetical protein